MRFEAKKKALSSAVKTVRSMTDALAATGSASAIHIIAEGKVVKLRTAAGGQVVESSLVDDVVVTAPGSAAVDAAALSNALSVGGDTFKVNLDGTHIDFACGRSKGRLEVKQGVEDADTSSAPKPTVRIPGFKAMLKAITLKGTSKTGERTLHFDAKARLVRGESTDSFRGITTVAPLATGEKLPGTASISLPAKAMDALGFLIEDCLIGFDEKFFSIKSPGLFVSLPQSTTPPVDIAEQLEGWLGSQAKRASFVVSIKEIKEAIADAIAISTDKSGSRLTVSLSPSGGHMLGEGDSGRVETDFSIVSTDATNTINAQIVPNFLRECLDFYSGAENVKIEVYTTALVLGLVDTTDLLARQTTAIPLLAEVTEEALKQPVAAKPSPAKKTKLPIDEDEEEKPVVTKKKAPAPVKKEKPKPSADEEEEEAPQLREPPVAAKEFAPSDDDEEDDDEDFDDEE